MFDPRVISADLPRTFIRVSSGETIYFFSLVPFLQFRLGSILCSTTSSWLRHVYVCVFPVDIWKYPYIYGSSVTAVVDFQRF